MTTPDEEITGYGGLPKTGPGNSMSSSSSTSSSGSASGSSSASHSSPAEDAKAKARQVAEEAKTQGKSQLEGYRETAADEIERVAQGAKAAAEELKGDDRLGLSGYVSDVAESMVQLSENLRGKSVDELLRDVNRLARNNPALFITGSIALGFGLTRFARASSKRAAQSDYSSAQSSGFSANGHETGHDVGGLHSSSQQELNQRLNTGEPGTIGSVSNAGVSSATSTRPASTTGSSLTGAGTNTGTGATGNGSSTAAGSSGTSSTTNGGANLNKGLGVGSQPGSGLGTHSGRDGKGTDGGLF